MSCFGSKTHWRIRKDRHIQYHLLKIIFFTRSGLVSYNVIGGECFKLCEASYRNHTISTIWVLFWFLDSLLTIYATCLKDRKSCRKLQGFLLISCSVSSPLCLPFLYTILFIFLFIFLFHCLFHVSPLWIIGVLTCFAQITQTYFLWCLPAVCLSLAHPSSGKAIVFLLCTAGSSRVC